MAGTGKIVALIKALAPGVDPSVIEQAVTDWLDDHPEATTTVEDGSITEEKLASDVLADLAEIEELKEAIADILVEETSESFTVANGENTQSFYSNAASIGGLERTGFSDGVAKYTASGSSEANPYVYQSFSLASHKWLVGMKLKFTKLDNSLPDPTGLYMRFGKYGSFITKQLPISSGEWLDCNNVGTIEMQRIQVYASFASAPAANTFTIEIKDMYMYDVDDASDDMIAYIKEQQASSYQDGTVTYSIGSSGYAPDTTLSEAGKAADSKAVGDAIINAVKAPLDNNLQGVAFGTSLTARAVSGDGYMDYLPDLIGIDFDNQGIGSAQIKSSILNAIKAYTGYATKKVCIIEGFVNDWKFDVALGTWKDNTENSACGCLRSAINYILSQNATITIFVVLDHYGRNYSSDDRSSTAENTATLTQYEYYEELAKVCESLGIPVIKQYAESQISENTPQYLSDYIHCNALGAKQSANFIYSKMKQYFQNEQSNS